MLSMVLALVLAPESIPYRWRNVEIVGGGFVTGVITHPRERDLVYARTDIGGAYRWNPRTSRWVPLMDWITQPDWNLYGVESLAVDPNDPNRVYVAAGTYDNDWGGPGAILRSRDRGRTWQRTNLNTKLGGNMPGRSIGERLAVDPQRRGHVYFGTRNSGLLRSTDFGATWSRVETFPQVLPVYDPPIPGSGFERQPPEGHGVGWVLFHESSIYAAVLRREDALVRSQDGGATWTAVPNQPKGMLPHQAKVDAGGTMVVVYADQVGPNGVQDGQVWSHDPARGTWTEVTPEKPGPGNTFGYGGVAVDAKASGTWMVSTLCRWSRHDTVFRTTDAGKTWISLKDSARMDATRAPYLKWDREAAEFGHWIGDVEIDPHNPNRAWYVTGATIWGTDNLSGAEKGTGTDWMPRAEGLEETAVLDLISPLSGPPLISGLGDIAGFRHDDLAKSPAGGMWRNPLMSNTDDLDFAESKPNVVIRVGRGGRQFGAISEDGARSWRPFASQPSGANGGGSAAISADGKTVVWAPSGASVHTSSDGGATWSECVGAVPGGRVVSDRVDSNRFYLYDSRRGALWVSTDRGRSFVQGIEGLDREPVKPVAVPGRAGHVWLPLSNGLFVTRDGGKSLVRIQGVRAAHHVGFGKPAPGRKHPTVFVTGRVGGRLGVFRSTDEGQSWYQINDERTGFGTMNHVTGDPRVFGRVYLGTNGRGILVADPR